MLAQVSCKKDLPFEQASPADTIFPRSYLPIYPGSWWTYKRVSDSSTFTDQATGYVLDRISYNQFSSAEYYVPQWRGHSYFGYGFYNQGGADYFTKELEEDTGRGSWLYEPHPGDPRYSYWNVMRKVDSAGLTMTIDSVVYTDVIKVIQYDVPSGTTSAYSSYIFYYAKDVGLIRKDITTFGLVTEYYLIDHFINN